jgi:hypothetical protein
MAYLRVYSNSPVANYKVNTSKVLKKNTYKQDKVIYKV